MKSKVCWVIKQSGWQYNDEIYYKSEDNGGHLVKAFTKLDKAQDELFRREVEAFREKFITKQKSWSGKHFVRESFNEYSYDSFEYLKEDKEVLDLLKRTNLDIDQSGLVGQDTNFDKLTDRDCLLLVKKTGLNEFELVQVELEN